MRITVTAEFEIPDDSPVVQLKGRYLHGPIVREVYDLLKTGQFSTRMEVLNVKSGPCVIGQVEF